MKVSVDKKDSTKVTFDTYSGLSDGKVYNITLDGTTIPVTVTDGKIASVEVNKVTIPYATETEIKLISKDANGVVIDEAAYGSQDSSKYDFSLTTSDGYIAGSKLYLNKVGSTATGEITYKTGKYGADGKPEGNVGPVKFTITAVDQAAVNSYSVRIGTRSDRNYDAAKDNNKIAVDDTDKAYAYFKIVDADGNEISHYNDYTVESSDTNLLMIATGNGTKLDANNAGKYKNYVVLEPVNVGTAYLLIKKNNTIVGSFAVSVVDKRKVASITFDTNSVELSNVTSAHSAKITAAFKDQYADDFSYTEGSLKVTCQSTTANGIKTSDVTESTYYNIESLIGNKQKVEFIGAGITAGTYAYKIAYCDKNGTEVVAQNVTVSVKAPGDAGKSTLSFDLDMSASKVDTTISQFTTGSGEKIEIQLAEKLNGTTSQFLDNTKKLGDNTDSGKQSEVKGIYYTVKKGNNVVYRDGYTVGSTTVTAVTSGAINAGSQTNQGDGKLTVNASTIDGSKNVSKLDAGTYEVTAVLYTLPSGKTDSGDNYVKKTVQKSFTIDDKQDIVKVSFTANKVDAGTTIENALKALVDYSYDGVRYNANGDTSVNVVSIEGTTNATGSTVKIDAKNFNTLKDTPITAGKTLNVTKITVSFTYEGFTLTQTVAINGNPSITTK